MFKRISLLTMLLAGSLAVFQPAVAQARDWDDHHYDRREDRREYRREERRDFRRDEWRARERYENRYDRDRSYYSSPYRYERRPVYVDPYCPR